MILHFDGGIRAGQLAYGFMALDPQDRNAVLFTGQGRCGRGSSNRAEYRALICGLHACIQRGIKTVHIHGDSQLIVNQVLLAWEAKQPDLIKHRDGVLRLLARFEVWTIKWVPRAQNSGADALVNAVFETVSQGGSKQCKHESSQRRSD